MRKLWTNEEDEIIKNNYSEKGPIETAKLLENRTPKSVTERASKLKIKRKRRRGFYGRYRRKYN